MYKTPILFVLIQYFLVITQLFIKTLWNLHRYWWKKFSRLGWCCSIFQSIFLRHQSPRILYSDRLLQFLTGYTTVSSNLKNMCERKVKLMNAIDLLADLVINSHYENNILKGQERLLNTFERNEYSAWDADFCNVTFNPMKNLCLTLLISLLSTIIFVSLRKCCFNEIV